MAIKLDKHEETPWLMFTDLTMALFVLFLIAFIFMSSLKSDKEAELTNQIEAFTRKEAEFQKEKLAKERAEKERDVLLTNALGSSLRDGSVAIASGNIHIQAKLLFQSGSPVVLNEGRALLTKLSKVMVNILDSNEMIMVAGYTDDIPINSSDFQSNWELSTKRATNVVSLLIQNGFPPNGIFAAGFGEHNPKVPNTNEANRMINRRVEIIRVPSIKNKFTVKK